MTECTLNRGELPVSQELLDRLPRLSDWYNINDDFWPEPERNNKLDWPATMRGFGTSQKGQGEDVIDEVAVCVLKVGVADAATGVRAAMLPESRTRGVDGDTATR